MPSSPVIPIFSNNTPSPFWTNAHRPKSIQEKSQVDTKTSDAVPNLDSVVREIADEMRQRPDRGEVATYIPELARIDAHAFGLVAIDTEGNVAAGGDSETPFSIQSISKVFT